MDYKISKFLPSVTKPTRYLGDELNVTKKSISIYQVHFALAFPDIYDVGMSHLGLKILYSILNSRDDVYAERVFAPWVDMEEYIRKEDIPLFSLESLTPLKEFDIIGFSLQYELSYTNVLNMLSLADIPLFSYQRDKSFPLIIAGGPCVFNPEPVADFIDLFVIGDGEEVIHEIIDCYKLNKDKDRIELLSKMSEIEGVYVPSLASLAKQSDGTIIVYSISDNNRTKRVKKRIVKDLNNAKYPENYVVPFMRPVHDRAVIEIMRGCSRGCRFCQAGMIYRPVRERSTENIKKLAEEVINNTGYEELSLSSLSTCDHSSIYETLKQLIESLGIKKHVSISLPSLRADAFSVQLAKQLERTGKTGLTFAPEVATEKMQNVVNKHIPKTELLSTVESAFSSGWDSLKLYFMIGLPTETDEDVKEITRLTKAILQVAVNNNKRANINVSVANFVPKSHTPFQWERQSSIKEIQEKQNIIMGELGRNRRISLSFTNPQVSFLEGVFARGDRRLSQVLLAAHNLGSKLDGWTEFFNFDTWMAAFQSCGINPEEYLRARNMDEPLPWEHIDSGITKGFLISEVEKAYNTKLTPDCRTGKCTSCGIQNAIGTRCWTLNSSTSQKLYSQTFESNKESDLFSVMRIRFQFTKGEELKFISHLDLINAFTRAFRRAGIPIAYSHGFSPNPKLMFGSVLPVGTISESEFADIELESYMSPQDFLILSNNHLPPGLEILKAEEVSLKAKPLMAQINLASYKVIVNDVKENPKNQIDSLMNRDHIWINQPVKDSNTRKKGLKTSKTYDIRPSIRNISLLKYNDRKMELEMVLGDNHAGKVRPEQIVRLILDDFKLSEIEIRKTGSFVEFQGSLFSPFDMENELSGHPWA